ncbi:MAG: NAD-glutamate dehydrogenase, partial [Proteobacteria bacterium]|nr:NAD-glutamate dehydrogenase [Pseudomonadota bacterium]
GGIGTYVKASFETAHNVGDAANDSVRVDAKQVRANVLGEGGNLGFTQQARLEAAGKGIKLNTDAIDNSGGVDTSDHEVNLKILMTSLLAEGQIPSQAARNQLLEDLTDEIAELVLVDNINQGQIISMDSIRSKTNAKPILDLIDFLIERKLLDPKTDNLSTKDELAGYLDRGMGILRPDLSILLSFTKMHYYKEIVQADALDDPFLDGVYYRYFPDTFRNRYDITKVPHALKKQIVGTVLVNNTVNQTGITLLPDILPIIDTTAVDIVVAYTVIDQVFDLGRLRHSVMKELRIQDINAAYTHLINIEKFMRNVLIWMLICYDSQDLKFSLTDDFRDSVQEFMTIFENSMNPDESRKFQSTTENMMSQGVSRELAQDLARGEFMRNAMEIIVQAQQTNISLDDAISLSQGIDAMFHFKTIQNRILRLKFDSDWSKKHRGLLLRQLHNLKQGISSIILNRFGDIPDFIDKRQKFMEQNKTAFNKYQTEYKQLITAEFIELSGVAILFENLAGILE